MPKIPQEIWNGRTKNPRIFGTGVPIIGGADNWGCRFNIGGADLILGVPIIGGADFPHSNYLNACMHNCIALRL